jgi:hypothetical protein
MPSNANAPGRTLIGALECNTAVALAAGFSLEFDTPDATTFYRCSSIICCICGPTNPTWQQRRTPSRQKQKRTTLLSSTDRGVGSRRAIRGRVPSNPRRVCIGGGECALWAQHAAALAQTALVTFLRRPAQRDAPQTNRPLAGSDLRQRDRDGLGFTSRRAPVRVWQYPCPLSPGLVTVEFRHN